MNHQPVVRTFQEKIKFTIKIIHFNNIMNLTKIWKIFVGKIIKYIERHESKLK